MPSVNIPIDEEHLLRLQELKISMKCKTQEILLKKLIEIAEEKVKKEKHRG